MPLITAVKCDRCGFAKTFKGHIAKYKFVPMLRELGWCISDEKVKRAIQRTYCPKCKEYRLSEMGTENLKWNERGKYHD